MFKAFTFVLRCFFKDQTFSLYVNNNAVNQHFISFRFTLKTHVVCILYCLSIYFCFLLYLHLCLQLLSSLLSRKIHCNLLMLKSINKFKYIAHIVENMHCCYFFCEDRKLYNRHDSCKKKKTSQSNGLSVVFVVMMQVTMIFKSEEVPTKLSHAVIKMCILQGLTYFMPDKMHQDVLCTFKL